MVVQRVRIVSVGPTNLLLNGNRGKDVESWSWSLTFM